MVERLTLVGRSHSETDRHAYKSIYQNQGKKGAKGIHTYGLSLAAECESGCGLGSAALFTVSALTHHLDQAQKHGV